MEPFTYLAALVSVVIGLAMANVLAGIARTIHGGGRVRPYWPSLVWAVIVFLACVQHWWADFSLAHHQEWTLASFAAVLSIPVALYLLSSFVLPQAEHAGATDLRAWYFSHRVPFFVVLMFVPLLSFLKEFAVDGHVAGGPNFWAQAAIVGLQIPPLATTNESVHKTLALIAPVYALAYFMLLFRNLPHA